MFIAMDMGTSNTRLWLCEGETVLHFAKAAIGAGITKKRENPSCSQRSRSYGHIHRGSYLSR